MKKLKIAVIGVGNISETHIAAYKKNEDVELYAFCDINENTLKKKGAVHGISRLYNDEKVMLEELPEIDAVSVCTWNSAHATCSIMALKAGKDVLCEKPMAINATEAEEMLKVARECGRKLMVGFVRRFGNDTEVVKDFIDGGQIGEIYYAKATYLRRNGCPGGWFSDKARSGGGPLIDLGVHVIDLTRYLMGNPRPVSVYGATFNKIGKRKNLKDSAAYLASVAAENDKYDVEDMVTALVRYDNGSVLSIEASFNLNIKNDTGTIDLYGARGGATLNPEFELYTEMNGHLANVSLNKSTALSFDGLFEKEINYFVDALINDTDLYSIAEDGVTLMRIIDAIYKSAECGSEVKL